MSMKSLLNIILLIRIHGPRLKKTTLNTQLTIFALRVM